MIPPSQHRRTVIIGFCSRAVCLTLWGVSLPLAWAEPPASDVSAGKAAYTQQCSRCHGDHGRGDGVDAKRFYPRPRDLTLGVYKFRSTASGTPPTDEDLFRTITNGLPGTNMPDWKHLDEATRWQLVYYLKNLSPVFQQTKPEPIAVASDPGLAHADLKKGRQLYEQLGCAACHGPQGRANGTSAGGLVDDWGKPIRPANLTKGWSYRGGSNAHAVMLRMLAGIDGAGMPSYAGALSAADAWPLAYYVTLLQEPAHWNLIAHATRVSGTLPMTLDDPRWDAAEQTDVRVRNVVDTEGEWVHPPTVSSVAFRVLVNNQAIAFRFTWDDPTHDHESSPDRFALLLRPPRGQGDVVTLQAWPSLGAPPLDLCTWSADSGKAFETVATDYERVEHPVMSARQLTTTTADYQDGRWQLMMQRPLRPTSPADAAALSPDVFNPIAIAVWDGGNPTARAVSTWVEIVLRPAFKAGAPATERR